MSLRAASGGALRRLGSGSDLWPKYQQALAAHDNLLKTIPKRVQMERDQAVLSLVRGLNRVQNFCFQSPTHKAVLPELEKCLNAAGFASFEPAPGQFFDPECHEPLEQKDLAPPRAPLAETELVVLECHSVGVKNSKSGACVV